VLIHADAQGLRRYFHQFGQWIHQPPGNTDLMRKKEKKKKRKKEKKEMRGEKGLRVKFTWRHTMCIDRGQKERKESSSSQPSWLSEASTYIRAHHISHITSHMRTAPRYVKSTPFPNSD
jgi:hypothetical protein